MAELEAQIGQTQQKLEALDGELSVVDAELELFSADRQRYDALRNVCTALDRLKELKSEELFWEGVADAQTTAGYLEQAKGRVANFDGQISGLLEKQASLKARINQGLVDLEVHYEGVRDAYARDERRQDEYVVERDISSVPEFPSLEEESEKRYRRALLIALLSFCFISVVMLLWKLPPPVRPVVAEVPQRLVSMLRKEPPKPAPPRPKDEKKPDQEKTPDKAEDKPKPTSAEKVAARQKAESTGVLAFKDSFKDLMEEAPASKLGAEARLNNQSAAAGQARASRSLVAMQAGAGTSGGISNAGVSRNIGSPNGSRLGGVGFSRVESSVAGAKGETRPLSSGPGPARTDEEIQIVFDRYKATLYRMYNAELRKDPTLRGKLILRITIEPGGEVSACSVQSSDLASPGLVAQIVERVKKFNFGPKEKVTKITILYPIDFLPGS